MAKQKAPKSSLNAAAAPTQAVAAWSPRRRKGPRAIGSYVPQIARPAIEKYGFASAALIEQWSRFAGSELSAFCQPERIRWPRRQKEMPEPDKDGESEGATLVLRVDPARALDVQYASQQIIERINASFGYSAVSRITLVQAPIARRAPTAQKSACKSPRVAEVPHGGGLEGALGRMEALRRMAQQRRG